MSVMRCTSGSSAASRYACIPWTSWSMGDELGRAARAVRAWASSSTSAYTDRNSSCFVSKWWYTAPFVTRASRAMSSMDVAS